jgi:predicted DNA-binding transcriptional regulator AlpA
MKMNMNKQKFMRAKEVTKFLNISKNTLYCKIHRGSLTKPVKISKGLVGWPVYEIEKIYKTMLSGADESQIRALVVELMAMRKDDRDGLPSSKPPIYPTKLELVEA